MLMTMKIFTKQNENKKIKGHQIDIKSIRDDIV